MNSNTASESQPEKHTRVCICPHLEVNPHSLLTTWFNLFQDSSLKPLNELSPLWCFCRGLWASECRNCRQRTEVIKGVELGG